MARSGKTAQEFIKDSFSPIIAVLCSPKVEYVVSKNNLTFTELLQPFSAMDWEGYLKEPSGGTCTIKNWKLILRDVNWKPLPPTEARRQLNNAVFHNYHDKTVSMEYDSRKFDIPQSTYWFDAWRETYLDVQFPSDHEFTKHFLSCIIVGVAHDDNVIDSFNSMNQQYAQLQNVTPPKLPKWFNNGVLKCYLLLHDASVISREKADVTFESLKQTFGASNCFILSINSKSASDPILNDMWAPYILRTTDSNNDNNSSSVTQATTPAEPQTVFPQISVNLEDGTVLTTSQQADNSHPLTSPDDIYDNANSLQTHSFSGSSESVSVTSKGIDLSTEVHGTSLNQNDIDDIKKFLQDYAQKTLLPHIEKQIGQLSEVVANRKGVSRSLLSATKRWFGTGKTGNNSGNSTVIYTSDCPELQLRRLGDLWFMCGQWQRAFDAYHTAKREFYADSAWLFYAGALEMAAISAFMAGDANRKTHGYMEESIVTYLNTCRMVQYAVRATLLSVLCLNSAGLHGEAARQLIRMTSEDSDLRSAMLLEQAALCFLAGPPARAMCRKYAFHMVLAGHRFSKAGQKKHAYRCYKQAFQVYSDSGWRLATDHVQFALGRLAGALRLAGEARRWLAAPLAPPRAAAHHAAPQHHAFLREYMLAHQQWMENGQQRDTLAEVPLPLVVAGSAVVVAAGPAPLAAAGRAAASAWRAAAGREDAPAWTRLEEMLLQVAQGQVPMIFKPTVDLYDDTTDCDPVVPRGEPVQISTTLWNPLKIPLVLKDVELLWKFRSASGSEGDDLNNEPAVAAGGTIENNVIFGQKIKSVLLEEESKKVLTFVLTPMRVGKLSVHGLAYKLINVGEGGNENDKGGAISGKLNLLSGVRHTDRRLQIAVIPEAPCLQMTFSETSPDIVSGEMRTIDVEFTNVGPVEMKNVHVAVSHPDCIGLVAPGDDDLRLLYEDRYREPDQYPDERSARAAAWRALAARHVTRAACPARAALRLRASRAAPAPRLLAYYETGLPDRPYRLLRHVFHFNVTEAIEVSVIPRRTLGRPGAPVAETMSLAVEVKNVSEEGSGLAVEPLEVELLGRQWRLRPRLVAPGCRGDRLAPRERLHLVLKAERIVRPLPEGVVDRSRVQITEIDYRKDAAAVSRYVPLGPPAFTDGSDGLGPRPKPTGAGLIDSMFILRWKVDSPKGGAIGQHCLWLDSFSPTQSRTDVLTPAEPPLLQIDESEVEPGLRESPGRKGDEVVLFSLEHPPLIQHDFKQRKICLIPITLNIVNCYRDPVDVFIDIMKQKNREGGCCVGWAGALSAGGGVRRALAALGSVRAPLRVVCAAPGTHLLGAAFRADHVRLLGDTSLLVVQQAA